MLEEIRRGLETDCPRPAAALDEVAEFGGCPDGMAQTWNQSPGATARFRAPIIGRSAGKLAGYAVAPQRLARYNRPIGQKRYRAAARSFDNLGLFDKQ